MAVNIDSLSRLDEVELRELSLEEEGSITMKLLDNEFRETAETTLVYVTRAKRNIEGCITYRGYFYPKEKTLYDYSWIRLDFVRLGRSIWFRYPSGLSYIMVPGGGSFVVTYEVRIPIYISNISVSNLL